MRFSRPPSIRRKQLVLILGTTVASLLLACASFVAFDVLTFRSDMVDNLSSLAGVVGNNVTAAIDFGDEVTAEETLSALRAERNIDAARIYDHAGALFAEYNRPNQSETHDPPAMLESGHLFHRNHLYLFQPIHEQGEVLGTMLLVSNLEAMSGRIWRYAAIVSLVFVLSSTLALFLSTRLERVISAPILSLARLMRGVAEEKNYSRRATRTSEDEIGQLVDGFNEMLTQIQTRDADLEAGRRELEKRVEERTAELRQALAESARDKARFKFIFDSVPVGISWLVPGDDDSHLVNHAHEHITGVSAEASRVPGAFARASHPGDYQRQQELTGQFLRGEIDHYSIEKRFLHPGGRTVWAVLSSRMFVDPANGRKQSVTTLVDITERKLAESELQYERDLLRSLLDSSPDAIYFKDRNSRFIRCSGSMARALGLPNTDDLIGIGDADIFPAALARAAFADEQRIMETGVAIINKTERTDWPDGRVSWTLSNKMPLRDSHGTIIGTMGISKNITAIKEAEEKLAATHQQLLQASRQAGMAEVATGVLHNVGNVLNSVNVSATLVADSVRKSEISQLARLCALLREHEANLGAFFSTHPKARMIPGFLQSLSGHLATEQETILREIGHLRKNVEHIKEVVVMQQSYAKVSGLAESVPVVDLIEDSLRMNAESLARHDVTLVRDFQTEQAIVIEKHKVLQILVNLIRNAQFACDEAKRPDKQLTVRATDDGSRVKISVTDNGVGIPAENLTRIFSHGFTTRKTGHGFGLHSGALAAQELGGSLHAFSAGPGQGATFTLELPLRARARNAA